MKVLVTGNEGYIGSVLTEKLIAKGHQVIGLDFGIFRDSQFIPRKTKPQIQIYKDVRDIEKEDLEEIEAVVHLAALCNDPLGNLKPGATYEINYQASVNLAKLAKEVGVKRFLFSSSCSMYGVSKDKLVTEETEFNPQTPYAISKVKAEEKISKLANDNFSPVFLRNATVFGNSPRMRLDLVTQNLAAYGYVSKIITILSDGLPWRPLIHVQDVADAFSLVLEAPREKIHNQAFNIGHQENNVQVKDIAEMVKEVMPNTRVEIKNENPSDSRSYRVDFSKIYSLGFNPRYTILDGIRGTCQAFQKVGLTKDDFESSEYITLKKYQELIELGKMDNNFRIIKF